MSELLLDAKSLSRNPALGALSEEILQTLIAAGSPIELGAGETLFEAGDPYGEALFIVHSGVLDVLRSDGSQVPNGPGDVVGLSNYLDNEDYRSTARARSRCTVLALPADRMESLERRYPPLFNALNHALAERIRARSSAGHGITGALARPVRASMKAPLATCSGDISLREAYRTMQRRKIGSLGVLQADGTLLGILTCSGVSEALALRDARPEDSVMQAACETPYTIAPDEPLWQADEMLQRHGIKYLVAVEQNVPVGVISQSDILRALIDQHTRLLDQSAEADTREDLAELYQGLYRVAREARDANRLASRAVRLLSDAHLALQRRCVQWTLEDMRRDGRPPAPCEYAVLIMGSGGRREMLLTPDQDNALIIDSGERELTEAEAQWFADFARRLNTNLDRVGYILCPGDIMARNPMFRKTARQWRHQLSHLLRRPNEKAARWSNIVFDFDTLYGDERLTHALRDHLLKEIAQHRRLLDYMVEDDAEGRPPLGLFNRLITTGQDEHAGTIDLKRNGLRIVCDAARVYALSAGIAHPNTIDRLQALVREEILSADLIDSVRVAYEELLDMLLSHQIEQRSRGQAPDKFIDPARLSSTRRSGLRAAMRAVKRLQDQLQGHFGRSAF